MPRKLKVWYGHTFISSYPGQVKAIVAATSQKEAAKIAHVSLYEFRIYWSETDNKADIDAATRQPNALLWRPLNSDLNWRPVE